MAIYIHLSPLLLIAATIAVLAITTGLAARVAVVVEDFLHDPPCQDQQ